MANIGEPLLPFGVEFSDFAFDLLDEFLRMLNVCCELALGTPTRDLIFFLSAASDFGVDFGAELALFLELLRLEDQPHAAGLAGPVLLVAVDPKLAPLPVAARIAVLIKETHLAVVFVAALLQVLKGRGFVQGCLFEDIWLFCWMLLACLESRV
jgi:hypothetical protein